MIVYIWKNKSNVPFYVGFTKNVNRSNPRNANFKTRNWLTKKTIEEIGIDNIVVEIIHVNSTEEGQALECKLINEYGRLQTGNGPLTNLKEGGGIGPKLSDEARNKLSEALKNPNHPIRSDASRKKRHERMMQPDMQEKMRKNNPAKTIEARAKIKAKWADPEYRNKRIAEKLGKPIHSEEEKERRRQVLLDPSNPMRNAHIKLNSDPQIAIKRNAALQSLESRENRSRVMKESWARRKAEKQF